MNISWHHGLIGSLIFASLLWLTFRDSAAMRRSVCLVGSFFTGLSCQAPSGQAWGNDTFGPLRFKADGTFQLAIFEDLHFGESKSYS